MMNVRWRDVDSDGRTSWSEPSAEAREGRRMARLDVGEFGLDWVGGGNPLCWG